MPRVPTTREVIPGASVNIILKADQPTGRTVSGCIADVLTRGNHPRGIKVRLTDGRVGRVQSMRKEGDPSSSSVSSALPAEGPRTRTTAHGAGAEQPPQNIGLDAYITPARPRQNRRGGRLNVSGEAPRESEVATCPVCGAFEGDEAAVAYHVAGHFAD
ncbi:YwbE family protein [Aspergillus homomorphus CBS 101889]|uniref:UBZ4-type domain-containing protein n=1 Tax=Aspergillus homomorphus (strain CBS 101889) TaxID=1450537 RepID=A0A395HM06_ASPHC|nr:hypothetical protein BO97DRAFT_408651 [Aspergillus homomorphus CBS 101889]RAL07898.1 hypothetical protein BO97DRAFT_408651 [Aspergillus homomorphus CBS 101889]